MCEEKDSDGEAGNKGEGRSRTGKFNSISRSGGPANFGTAAGQAENFSSTAEQAEIQANLLLRLLFGLCHALPGGLNH